MDAEELLRRYSDGQRDFQRIILKYADLSGVELQNIDLTEAQFNYVNLSGLNLHRCELGGAEFLNCNLREAKITSCHLECTRFFDCDFRGVNTSGCNLTRTNFIRVNFENAKIFGFGEEPCECWDITREDGVFIPGFAFNPFLSSHKTNTDNTGL